MSFKKILLQKIALPAAWILLHCFAFAQTSIPAEFGIIDTAIFQDASHHWYDLYEKNRVIQPRARQPRYKATDLTSVADNILLYQKNNGGWPKNYDMLAILTPQQKDSLIRDKNVLNTTFDNRTTYSHIACLAKIYYVTKIEKYKEAALKGLDYIMDAQYDNGGWPQYFPLEKNYSRHITYNDDAFAGIMLLLKDIIEEKPQYDFIDGRRRKKLKASFDKGIKCILKTQINDAGKPTAWCQQYDEISLEPAWARAFEPPSICNGESVEVVSLLMSINNPGPEIINAVQNAVAWFKESEILETRVKVIPAPDLVTPYKISKSDRVVVHDSLAPPIWTRYYELKTHRPLFCNRDSKVVYSLAEVSRERRDGYTWYTYAPQKILNEYPAWQQKWAKDYNVPGK
ncbi:MAG: pectate lyase [Bacteroidota bacterium]|nr:pectate lyase [Bacteroidota bacterium]